MFNNKNQKNCVQNVERFKYFVYSSSMIEIHTVRLKKDLIKKLFTNDKNEIIFIKHDSTIFVNIIITAIRAKIAKKKSKIEKYHKSIRRMLKRKIEKKEKLFIFKT